MHEWPKAGCQKGCKDCFHGHKCFGNVSHLQLTQCPAQQNCRQIAPIVDAGVCLPMRILLSGSALVCRGFLSWSYFALSTSWIIQHGWLNNGPMTHIRGTSSLKRMVKIMQINLALLSWSQDSVPWNNLSSGVLSEGCAYHAHHGQLPPVGQGSTHCWRTELEAGQAWACFCLQRGLKWIGRWTTPGCLRPYLRSEAGYKYKGKLSQYVCMWSKQSGLSNHCLIAELQ